ncbi:MAG TPA: TetR family transcriptional regulator [Actinomycetota bacterium]|nr:TetR family transcriptional regulator [Actinomycetota bacterium]
MRTGRRPGDSGAREAILEAARANFAARGYDGATIRNIARDAGVDPALVHHYFGSKERIFAAAVDFPFDPSKVLPSVVEPGIEGLGERLVRLFVTVWDEAPTRSPLLTLMRSAVTHDPAAALLREFIEREVLARIAGAIDRPDRRLRAALASSQLVGLAMLRYFVHVEPLASAPRDEIVRCVAPAVQHCLAGDFAAAGEGA